MSAGARRFSAVLSHDAVCLVEYRVEGAGVRVVDQWTHIERSSSIDDALSTLITLLSARNVSKPRVAIAIEQFGVFQHVMTLPAADDAVLLPIAQREVQRLFGVADPVVAIARGVPHERREAARANARTAPIQIFIAGAPRETIDTLRDRLGPAEIDVEIATVVPKAIHSLYQATGSSIETTAVLVCLEGGPHLSFFLDGRQEMAIDPPIALEGERASVAMILDQVERGAVYFRQQFRGAAATRMYLSSRPGEYDALSAALEQRLGVNVEPLFPSVASPEAVVAMGAVLESRHVKPLDLFPHPPTFADRARQALRGPNGIVAGAAAAALVATVWSATQLVSLSSARSESQALRTSVSTGVASLEPVKQIAERRADYAHQVEFVEATHAERAALTATLRGLADQAPNGIRFDTLRVSRAATSWAASITGEATGTTAAQAVRSLDAFYQSIRRGRGISTATLDDFDYPSSSSADSTRRKTGPVVIQFRLSLAIDRAEPGAVR